MQINKNPKELVIAVGLSLLFLASSCYSQMLVDKLGGAIPLFNGQDIAFWNQDGNANWYAITPHGVAAEQGFGVLKAKIPVTDFQLQFSYWLDKDTDLSVYAHCVDMNYISSDTALQINLSSSPIGKYGIGSVVGMFHARSNPARLNHWNDVTISSISNQLTVTVNGITTINKVDYSRFLSGPFAIKYSGGKLRVINAFLTIPGRW